MNPERYRQIEGKYFPIPKGEEAPNPREFTGDYWRVWSDGSKYFLEYDEGHFGTKMKTVEISAGEYEQLTQGTATVADVVGR